MLVDGGAELDLISLVVISKLQIAEEEIELTGMFQGVNPCRSHPKGKITLRVTFGGELNYRTEKIVFDVVDLPLPYNGILGCPALAKIMAASHYAYNTLKMPGSVGVISIPTAEKDAIICVDKMYQDAVAAQGAEAVVPDKESIGKKKDIRDDNKESEKRTSSEYVAPVDDLLESSNSKRSKAVAPHVKKVPTGLAGADGTFTVSATLDDK